MHANHRFLGIVDPDGERSHPPVTVAAESQDALVLENPARGECLVFVDATNRADNEHAAVQTLTLSEGCAGLREDDSVETISTSAVGSGTACRATRNPDRISARAVATASVLMVVGLTATAFYMPTTRSADLLNNIAIYDLWTGLLAGMVGFALAAAVMFIVRWQSIVAVAIDRPSARTTLGWCVVVVVVLGAILGGLIVNTAIAPPSIGRSANRSTWPVTIIVAACAIPGLVTFLAIRWIAADDHNWREDSRCRTQILLRLRVELRRSLAALGALLTLLVVTAGTRPTCPARVRFEP